MWSQWCSPKLGNKLARISVSITSNVNELINQRHKCSLKCKWTTLGSASHSHSLFYWMIFIIAGLTSGLWLIFFFVLYFNQHSLKRCISTFARRRNIKNERSVQKSDLYDCTTETVKQCTHSSFKGAMKINLLRFARTARSSSINLRFGYLRLPWTPSALSIRLGTRTVRYKHDNLSIDKFIY